MNNNSRDYLRKAFEHFEKRLNDDEDIKAIVIGCETKRGESIEFSTILNGKGKDVALTTVGAIESIGQSAGLSFDETLEILKSLYHDVKWKQN